MHTESPSSTYHQAHTLASRTSLPRKIWAATVGCRGENERNQAPVTSEVCGVTRHVELVPEARCIAVRSALPCLAIFLIFTVFGCFGGKTVQTQVVADMPAPAEAGPYKIGSDDTLDVLVWKQGQLSGRLRVGSDGNITLPLVGRVQAAGLTTDQLQADLAKRLATYVHDPQVTVRVFDPASRVVYVLGEVRKPGMYRLMSGEGLSQALATAGGPTEYASLRKIKIIRHSGDKQVQMIVNYSAVNSGDLSADVPLQRGDTVMVP